MKKLSLQQKKHSVRLQKGPQLIWQISLAIVFFCFGMLVMAQYNTHVVEGGSLENESPSDLAQIMKSINDAGDQLSSELAQLNAELAELKIAAANGDSLNSSLRSNINLMHTVVGDAKVKGQGIILTITEIDNMIYQDVIDIINELLNSGAEAIAINNIRFTMRTRISEEARKSSTNYTVPDTNNQGGLQNNENNSDYQQTYYVITINGRELTSPLTIKAIGNPETLETALSYPGGIISNLTALYGVSATIQRMEEVTISATTLPELVYSAPPQE